MCVLPRAREAWVPDNKVRRYLLDLAHPKGADKARFFLSQGFDVQRWQVLQAALQDHAWRGVATYARREHGRDYWRVLGLLDTPSGKRPLVFSVWAVENEGVPRLISAYPR
jgi:hypothetical protein